MRYAKYKPTGIAWLPEVPEEWEIRRVASLLEVKDCPSAPNEELLSVFLDRGVIRFCEGGEKRANATSKDLSKYQLVEIGDFVMNNQQAWRGSVGVSKYHGIISPAYFVIRMVSGIDLDYADFAFRSKPFVSVYELCSRGVGSIQRNLIWNMFKQQYLPIPPLPTQRAIVAFLDEKCGKVDRLVAAKEKEVALLKELKQSMIAEAVTRGVPTALTQRSQRDAESLDRINRIYRIDGEAPQTSLRSSANSVAFASAPAGTSQNPVNPVNPVKENRRLVPSGIPWLPKIPEGWEERRAKYLFNKEQRPVLEGDEIVTCFRDGEVTLRKNRRLRGFTEATDYSHYQHICAGDLVIHQMDAFAGSCGVSDSDGMGTPVLSVCTPKSDQLDVRYFAAVVRLMGLNGFIQSLYRGIRERSSDFRFETFGRQVLPVPLLAEQREIVAHIEVQAAKIGAAVSGLEKEITALKEYKQRLIADVVTGQRRVA